MKILWPYKLSSVLLVVASGWVSMALSNAVEPISEIRTSNSVIAPSQPEPESTNSDDIVTAYFADYVYLHETRNQSNLFQIAERTNACDRIAARATN